ncbi:MAG: formimidoylglutamase [Bacteroidales bacterium]|nr:formimidoylglutamase [Bacteroidales bacterium]
MNLIDYLDPVDLEKTGFRPSAGKSLFGNAIHIYSEPGDMPPLDDAAIAILGVPEDRTTVGNRGCADGPDAIRTYLYALAAHTSLPHIVDIGNITRAETPSDMQYALAEVLYKLLERNLTVLILGGGQEFTFGNYKAYEILGRVVNICAINSHFAIGEDQSSNITSLSYLRHIVEQMPNYLFNFNNLGYQSYFIPADTQRLMQSLMFDTYRLGEVRADMELAEAVLRNSNLVSVDISAVRQSDAPAQGLPSPHGFYGEELCTLAHYAGLSDNVSSFGLYGLNPRLDSHGQTAHLCAHAVWYFIEGCANRKNDYPKRNPDNYLRFVVAMPDADPQMVFYKSKLTNRWWFEVPNNNASQGGPQCYLIPCTYAEYEQTRNGHIPERWWHFYQRHNS